MYVSAVVALIGLLMYLLSEKPKIGEVGRIMFFAGLLVFLLNTDKLIELFTHTGGR